MPTSFDQLIKLIQHPIPISQSIVRMWRGQGDISWPIHSSAYRRIARKRSVPTEENIRYYEQDLLMSATHRGFRDMNGRLLSDFELLARLQHHGAATRLVDFTKNALVGLFFSVASCPKKTGLLIGLHTDFMGGYEGVPEQRQYDEVFNGLEELKQPHTWEPPSVSPRITAQHSQFLYSVVSKQKTGSLWLSDSPYSYMAIALSPSVKRKCLNVLSEVFDIRTTTLFPDLDGFGEANSHMKDQYSNCRW